jgi:hypothetical protein
VRPSFRTPRDPGTLTALLIANRSQREAIAAQLSAAKEELRSLLLRGHAISMEVSEMSKQAGISRDTAHRIIREAGTMSWKQKREWAHAVLDAIPPDKNDIDQQLFRSHVETSLYSALGSQRDEVPPSLDAIFKLAADSISAHRGRAFVPRIDHDRLAGLSLWPVEPFEIVQRGTGESATFQIRRHGVELAAPRMTAEEVARDLRRHGGKKPTYIDRTGAECVTADGRRVGWDLLRDLE